MFFLGPLRYLAKALTAAESPRRIAAGFALGFMVGMVPKANLIAVALTTVLFALRVNLGAGLVSAFLFSWVSMLFDPLSHEVGFFLLTAGPLEPVWSFLAGLPVVPWTAFNNTVVLGSFVIALALCYPVYRASAALIARYHERVGVHLRRYRVVQVLLGAQIAEGIGGS